MASYTYIRTKHECLSDTATSGSTRGGIKGGGKLHTWDDMTSRVSKRKRCFPNKEGGIEERQRQALHAKRRVRESNSKRVHRLYVKSRMATSKPPIHLLKTSFCADNE